MKKGAIAIVVIILVSVVVIGLNKAAVKTAQGPIRIGGAFMVTGPAAPVGELQKKGADLAVETINKAGGINGRPVEIVVEDAGYDPKSAVSAYQALKVKGIHLFLIDGSPIVAATHKLVASDGNFTIAGGATAPAYFDGSNLTCRIALTAKGFAPGIAKLLANHSYKKVGVMFPDNEFGRGLSDEFTKAYTAQGGTIVVSEFYSAAAGTNDFRTNILKLKSNQSKYDALVVSNVLTNAEGMFKQMKELGLNKPIVSDNPTLENPSIKDRSLLEGAEFVDYEYVRTVQPNDSAKVKAFKEAYRAKYGIDPQYFSAGTYDSTLLLAEAVAKVGEDPQKVANYISSLKDYPGVTGTYTFDSDCEVSRNLAYRTVKKGVTVELK